MRAFFFIPAIAILSACAGETPAEPPVPTAPISATADLPRVVDMPAAPTVSASKLEDIDFKAYSPALAGIVGLTEGETRLESIDKIRLFLAPGPGQRIISTASVTFERDDGAVLLFTNKDLPDDSVKAQEIYAVFSGPGGDAKFNQTLAAYGMRVKCRRGANTTEWQTDLCP